jgi:ATP-binding cassette, subfamily B, bacterial
MKSILESPVIYLWRKMYHYAQDRRKNIKIATAMFTLAVIAEASQPLIFGYFLDFVQKNGVTKENLTSIFLILLLFLASEIIFWTLWGPARLIEQKTAFMAKKNYKEYLLQGVMSMPMGWHTDRHSGNTIDKIEKGTNAVFDFSSGTYMFIEAFIKLFTSLIVLSYFSFSASLIIIVTSIFIFYILYLYDKKLIPGYTIVNRLENKISERVYDVISNITTVIILRITNLVFKSISRAIDTPFSQFKKNVVLNELKWFWAGTLGQLAVIIVLCVYLFTNVSAGNAILVGSIYILYSYASNVKQTFFSFANLYNDTVKWRTRVANAEEISKDFKNIQLETMHLPKGWSTLDIKNLSFSYHGDKDAELHLDNVNIGIQRGDKIAVIGESGGGKTTFLKLLRGLYSPKSLTIDIDSKKSSRDFHQISECISLIPQDPEIFSTTIKENITLGVDYDKEEIAKFVAMASFQDVVLRLPKGLESSIVEKGVNLSGGEKQRLALARGLLASKDKDIILLDEPTSSVDFHNELRIYENIFESMPRKTIISSIHRLHLLALFDNIFFFKDGKIAAQGNLETLKSTSADFQALWDKYIKTQNQ